jgi:hypothetical protein
MDGQWSSSPPYQELAGQFTTRLDVLLSSKRALVRAWLGLSRSWHGQVHHVFGSETAEAALDRLHAEIEVLQRRRNDWVPRSSPEDPRYWIAAYDRLARLCEGAAGTSGDPEARHLHGLARRYRRRQQAWQRRAAAQPSAPASSAKSPTTRSGS